MAGDELELRASDEERERIAGELAEARVEGRITLDELSDRLDRVYAARTRAELEPLVRDLPAVGAPTRRPTRWIVSFLGGSSQTGRWRIERKTRAIAMLGSCDLDLRRAEVEGPEATITACSFLGGIDITVPQGIDVELGGFSLVGGRNLELEDAPRRPGTPLIRVRAFAFFGGVNVRTPAERLPG